MLAVSRDKFCKYRWQVGAHCCGITHQDYTVCRLHRCIDKLSEITILGDEDSLFTHGYVNDICIIAAGRNLDHGRNVVARGAQRPHYTEIAALIRKEPHSRVGLRDQQFFMSKRIRRIGDGGLNVTLGEVWIGLQQVPLAGSIT